jgi:hypothetical protein
MVPPADKPAHLSVNRAFGVQFQSDTAVLLGRLAGRVEHVVSRQATDFQLLETLLTFIAQVLREEHDRSADQRACGENYKEETMRYDVIIEAGFAGCALATRLSEDPSRSVLLLGWGQIIRSSTASPRTSSERCH